MIGTLIGGITAARAMRDYNRSLDADERRARRRRDRLLSEDPTQRADARRLLQKLDAGLRDRTRATTARAALTGGSADAAAIDKAAATRAMADATAAIAAAGEARASRAETDYEQTRNALREQRRRLIARQTEETVKAGGVLDGMIGNIMLL